MTAGPTGVAGQLPWGKDCGALGQSSHGPAWKASGGWVLRCPVMQAQEAGPPSHFAGDADARGTSSAGL